MSQDPTDLLTALRDSVERARQQWREALDAARAHAGRTLSDDEHAAMVERTLSAVSTTCAELGITPADVEALDYEPPGATGTHACLTLDLADGRRVQIAKDGLGRREFTWTPAQPAIPEPARVELDAVRERLAEVRGGRRTLGRGPVVNPPTVTDVDGRIVVTWPAERGIVEVYPEVIEGWAETVNGLRADVERLTAERDGWKPLTAALNRSLDVERAEVTRLRRLVQHACNDVPRQRAEVARFRGLIAQYARWVEVCEGTDFLDREPYEGDHVLTAEDLAELLRIRREAGLT